MALLFELFQSIYACISFFFLQNLIWMVWTDLMLDPGIMGRRLYRKDFTCYPRCSSASGEWIKYNETSCLRDRAISSVILRKRKWQFSLDRPWAPPPPNGKWLKCWKPRITKLNVEWTADNSVFNIVMYCHEHISYEILQHVPYTAKINDSWVIWLSK